MKKLYTTSQWARYIKIRQQRELSKKRKRENEKIHFGPESVRRRQRRRRLSRKEPVYLSAPSNFSLLNNSETVISFMDDVRAALEEEETIVVALDNIDSQTPETLTFFLSVIADPAYRETLRKGTYPRSPALRKMFMDSGIFEHLRSSSKIMMPAPSGSICKKRPLYC